MACCTLCGGDEIMPVVPSRDRRSYHHCQNCQLIFVDTSFLLSKEIERSRYALHNNGIEHRGYVEFLGRVIDPCLPFITRQMRGLDYGCGPQPTLSKILATHHLDCYDYDPLFDFKHPYHEYDFIFATECFEHFFLPGNEFRNIDRLLKPSGYLGIMTERWETLDRFDRWYYKKDPTHVSFFHRNTFSYISEKFGYKIKYADTNRVMILQKADNC
jgi:SAM-dependent methyltransferase